MSSYTFDLIVQWCIFGGLASVCLIIAGARS